MKHNSFKLKFYRTREENFFEENLNYEEDQMKMKKYLY